MALEVGTQLSGNKYKITQVWVFGFFFPPLSTQLDCDTCCQYWLKRLKICIAIKCADITSSSGSLCTTFEVVLSIFP